MNKFSTGLSILSSIIAVGVFSGTASADSASDNGSTPAPQLFAVATSVAVDAVAGLRLSSDRSPAVAPGLEKLISTTPIRFVTSSGELGAVSRRNLRRLVVPLMVNSGTNRIVIEGHTDLRGDADVNERIGLERAEEVSEYLTSIGVPAEMLVVRSVGERRPLIAKTGAFASRVNRRVEIRLTK